MYYLVSYIYAHVKENEPFWLQMSRFTANNEEEVAEQIRGLKEIFYEEFPENLFPGRKFYLQEVFKLDDKNDLYTKRYSDR